MVLRHFVLLEPTKVSGSNRAAKRASARHTLYADRRLSEWPRLQYSRAGQLLSTVS
jgi:hypothetical protein